MSIDKIINKVRSSLLEMQEYQSARSLNQDENIVYLDANEIPYEPFIGSGPLNRYTSQQPTELVDALCRVYNVTSKDLLISRGADEAIDLLVRAFCTPKEHNIVICPPTFPIYEQSAKINMVDVRYALLDKDFQLDMKLVKKQINKKTMLVFVCSPNNPSGNTMRKKDIETLCKANKSKALIVVDETYAEFSGADELRDLFETYDNLILMRTLSKSYAAAGIRCGITLAKPKIISIMKKVLHVYPLPKPVVDAALKILEPKNQNRLSNIRSEIIERRDWFSKELSNIEDALKIYASDSNFILAEVKNAERLCEQCHKGGFIVRNQSKLFDQGEYVRISIGTQSEMEGLLDVLNGKVTSIIPSRVGEVTRNTNETKINVKVYLDNPSVVSIKTGIGFYDHMLEQIAKHAGIGIFLECDGDLEIDPHHTIEDCAIALGQAIIEALGDKRGIGRYGFSLPMDESAATALIDFSGRSYLKFEGQFPADHVGDLPTDMIEHIFMSMTENMKINCHISVEGENAHHMVEACFKAFGRALRQAVKLEQGSSDLPSTKGVL